RGDAAAQGRRTRRRGDQAGGLRRIHIVAPLVVARRDRHPKSLSRAGRHTEMSRGLNPAPHAEPMHETLTLPTFDDIESAARQIAGTAHRTPVATSRTVDARTSAHVFFKCENLQRAGAFKFRGAYNALSRLDADARRRGVVTFS